MQTRPLLAHGILAGAILGSIGCADASGPAEPLDPGDPAYPPLPDAVVVYEKPASGPSGRPSRLALSADGSVELQVATSAGGSRYPGTFTRVPAGVAFLFDRRTAGQPWEALGHIDGSSLEVDVNDVMEIEGLDDGAYELTSGEPLEPMAEFIHLARADGSGATLLTQGGRPAWSPDGQTLAFHVAPLRPMSARERARVGEIRVIGADGSNERVLGRGIEPSWSPDGERIVFTSEHGIAVMRADGSGIRTILRHDFRDDTYQDDDQGVGKPVWSPDGRRIAFEHRGDGVVMPARIFVMDADGSEPRRVTPDVGRQYAESDPAWSPDASRLVFWSFGFGIAVVASSGGSPTSVLIDFPTVAYGAKPVWKPNGTTIAFTAKVDGRRQVWAVPGEIDPLIAAGHYAVWSPDGHRLAFVRRW